MGDCGGLQRGRNLEPHRVGPALLVRGQGDGEEGVRHAREATALGLTERGECPAAVIEVDLGRPELLVLEGCPAWGRRVRRAEPDPDEPGARCCDLRQTADQARPACRLWVRREGNAVREGGLEQAAKLRLRDVAPLRRDDVAERRCLAGGRVQGLHELRRQVVLAGSRASRSPLGHARAALLYEGGGQGLAPGMPGELQPVAEAGAQAAVRVGLGSTQLLECLLPRAAAEPGLLGEGLQETPGRPPGDRPDRQRQKVQEERRVDGLPAEAEGQRQDLEHRVGESGHRGARRGDAEPGETAVQADGDGGILTADDRFREACRVGCHRVRHGFAGAQGAPAAEPAEARVRPNGHDVPTEDLLLDRAKAGPGLRLRCGRRRGRGREPRQHRSPAGWPALDGIREDEPVGGKQLTLVQGGFAGAEARRLIGTAQRCDLGDASEVTDEGGQRLVRSAIPAGESEEVVARQQLRRCAPTVGDEALREGGAWTPLERGDELEHAGRMRHAGGL